MQAKLDYWDWAYADFCRRLHADWIRLSALADPIRLQTLAVSELQRNKFLGQYLVETLAEQNPGARLVKDVLDVHDEPALLPDVV